MKKIGKEAKSKFSVGLGVAAAAGAALVAAVAVVAIRAVKRASQVTEDEDIFEVEASAQEPEAETAEAPEDEASAQ